MGYAVSLWYLQSATDSRFNFVTGGFVAGIGEGPNAAGTAPLFPAPLPPDISEIHDDLLEALDVGALSIPDTLTLSQCPAAFDPCFWGNGHEALELTDVTWSISEVPEPSTFLLLGLGLVGILAMSRRRR